MKRLLAIFFITIFLAQIISANAGAIAVVAMQNQQQEHQKANSHGCTPPMDWAEEHGCTLEYPHYSNKKVGAFDCDPYELTTDCDGNVLSVTEKRNSQIYIFFFLALVLGSLLWLLGIIP